MSSIILTISEEANVQQLFFKVADTLYMNATSVLAVMLTGYKLTVFCIFMDFLPKKIYILVSIGLTQCYDKP